MKNIYFLLCFLVSKWGQLNRFEMVRQRWFLGVGLGDGWQSLKWGEAWALNGILIVLTQGHKTIWAHSRTVKSTLFRWYFTHFWFYGGGFYFLFFLTLGTLKFLQYIFLFFSPLCKYKLHESLHMSVYATCLPFLNISPQQEGKRVL